MADKEPDDPQLLEAREKRSAQWAEIQKQSYKNTVPSSRGAAPGAPAESAGSNASSSIGGRHSGSALSGQTRGSGGGNIVLSAPGKSGGTELLLDSLDFDMSGNEGLNLSLLGEVDFGPELGG